MTPMPFAPLVDELRAANREARQTLDVPDEVLIARIANGERHKRIARRYGVTEAAVSMRLNRSARSAGMSTTAQLVAASVRDGRISWGGAKWVPSDAADRP